jgi:flagellar P-ring protein FlgI
MTTGPMKWIMVAFSILIVTTAAAATEVRVKDLARVDGARTNQLIGYGVVVGLAGTGDTARSRSTTQSIANALSRFGLRIDPDQMGSRNAAAVMVTANLPPFATPGESIDIGVSSLGDARSLVGGTLLMTPLLGPDERLYAMAQGAVTVGGFRYDAFGNAVQKNHPTAGIVSGGALVEQAPSHQLVTPGGAVHLILHAPDFTTASRIAEALEVSVSAASVTAEGPDRVVIRLRDDERADFVDMVRRIEGTRVTPDIASRVVINERTGTVVAGGNVRLSQVSVTHGGLRVTVDTSYLVSQPVLVSRTGSGVRTVVTPETTVEVEEDTRQTVDLSAGATVSDLAMALNDIKATPRDLVTVLQAVHRTCPMHAELVVQ